MTTSTHKTDLPAGHKTAVDPLLPGATVPPAAKRTALGGATSSRFKVRAVKVGYYDLKIRQIGDVFFVTAADFSDADDPKKVGGGWMSRDVAPETPETRAVPAQEQLQQEHAAIRTNAVHPPVAGPPTGAARVLGGADDDDQ